jgi:hypothetical protein
MKKHNAFENEIFEHYRQQQKKILKAIALLKSNDYNVYEKKDAK